VIAILGPTASGKSAVALAVAEGIRGMVLSVDSMQVYRGMDIGTAKPTRAEQARIPHAMIDLAEPEDEYTAAEFQREGRRVLAESGGPAVVVGGSGLHFRALVDPLEFAPHDRSVRAAVDLLGPVAARAELLAADPAAGRHLDLANPRRVGRAVEILRITGLTPSARAGGAGRRAVEEYRPLLAFRAFGLDPGERLPGRVADRLAGMREAGLLEEVRSLASRLGRTAAQAVGYRQLLPVATGHLAAETGFAAAERATLALARRQRTFFRRDPRIAWLDWSADPFELAERILAGREVPCAS
jgi:tRNA dimethylallyltransferase